MQKHIEITRKRLEKFAGALAGLFYPETTPVRLNHFAAPGRIPFDEAPRGEFNEIKPGMRFWPLWSTHWLKVEGIIPPAWEGQEVHFLFDSACEAMIWSPDGIPQQGLTGSFSSWMDECIRKDFRLAERAAGGEAVDLFVEVAVNGLFGVDIQIYNQVLGYLRQAEIAVFDRQAWDLYWDFKVIADMARLLPANSPRGGQALYAANAMVNAIRLDDRSSWQAARQIAAEFMSARNGGGQHNVSAIGHAHLDTAWLWPLAETKRKAARSFSSAVRYMEMYPDYKFACSQAVQHEWMKEQHPALYEKIKARVAAGQFVPVGGTWVEPDCNIPSGESLVRQFLFGQRFFQQEYGVTCLEFWNQDVFGYSGALPQIMRGAGIEFFLTQKLSWNQFNKPASHTFLWEGIDGSRVLTHFPPVDTYNSDASVKDILHSIENFKDHERARESLLPFGWGDGGGGPTPAMLEQLRRMSDTDGLPRVEIRAPQEFFERARDDLKDPTVWSGELYFEMHRGTYTSQARNKASNRRAELLLRDLEFLYATGAQPYPSADLAWMWKKVLTNQFHDIIPGSSIHEVYDDSTADYRAVLYRGEQLRESAISAIAGGKGSRLLAINTLSMPRREVADWKGSPAIVTAPAMGWQVQELDVDESHVASLVASEGGFSLENDFISAQFDSGGGLLSVIEKASGRESIAPGSSGNRFIVFDDNPNDYNAWDVDVFHLEKPLSTPRAASARVVEQHPLRVAVEFTYHISEHSTLTQIVSLDALSHHFDFACEVDWREKRKFLKVEFPLNVRAAAATYEIQFGHLQRPTHFNTTWDLARFEVPAHKWADLTESGFGVALLNDCKYGYSAHENILRLSLLRSPTYPDATADEGKHHFRYALLPHGGTLQEADVVGEAYRFNVPLLLAETEAPQTQASFFSVNQPSVVIDTVKKAEDSEALIVRLYESHGGRCRVKLSSPSEVKSAALCNLLENEEQPLEWKDGGVEFDVTPFKIVTLKLGLFSR